MDDLESGFAISRQSDAGREFENDEARSSLEDVAELLERSGDYKVLRRLAAQTTPLPEHLDGELALMVDVETTGLNVRVDPVIEFAVVPFQFDQSGNIIAVHEPISEVRDPGIPIPAEVTRLTGIDDAMVRGRSVDIPAVQQMMARASLVLAHNALFDRPMLGRLIPGFVPMPWACTMSDVPWREEGATTLRLNALAAQAGFFFQGHRAAHDCLAAVEILNRPLSPSGRNAMAELLRSARRETMRIAAVRAPFELKDVLKRRNYRWRETDSREGTKAWVIEVAAEALDDEVRFLRREIYGADVSPPVTRVDAYSRYSGRT